MCYPVCGMVHIKEPLMLIEKGAHEAVAGFPNHYLNGPLLSFLPSFLFVRTTVA